MFKNKVIVLSGDNKRFNNAFLKRFYTKAKEIRILTNDIFDSSYDEYDKVVLYSNIDDLRIVLKDCNYLFHYIINELKDFRDFLTINNDFTFTSEKLLNTALRNTISKIVFISDGSTSVANDKMIKNIVIKYSRRADKSVINYVLSKGANVDEIIDNALFAVKTMKNGEIFIKKVEKRVTFSERLKSLFSQKTKIERERDSFFTSDEMARMVDYGRYYKIANENEEYRLNIFADRLKSLEVSQEKEEEFA